jgi:23S rRNA-intervening sequence protein
MHMKLDVWKKSMDLAETIYKITSIFPKEERLSYENYIQAKITPSIHDSLFTFYQ